MKFDCDYSRLPEHLREGAKLYIEHGIPPGHFMRAVICNDLVEAVGRADHISLVCLPDIVRFFYNEAPGECWRSEEKMEAWMDAREADQAVEVQS